MGRYKKYDPSIEGFGSVNEWRQAWEQKMGVEQATAVLGENDPLTLLGFTAMPTKAELKKRYYKLCLQHQDCFRANATDEQQARAKEIIAAYSILEDKAK